MSLLGLTTLGVLSTRDPRNSDTIDAIRRYLWLDAPRGGCARYEDDRYQRRSDLGHDLPGNPWFISTLWLAECVIERARDVSELHEAEPYFAWCAQHALPSGVLAEQVDARDGSPLSVVPLTWSHSSLVWTALRYAEPFDALRAG